jgi:hypothetical protein
MKQSANSVQRATSDRKSVMRMRGSIAYPRRANRESPGIGVWGRAIFA